MQRYIYSWIWNVRFYVLNRSVWEIKRLRYDALKRSRKKKTGGRGEQIVEYFRSIDFNGCSNFLFLIIKKDLSFNSKFAYTITFEWIYLCSSIYRKIGVTIIKKNLALKYKRLER